MASLNRAEYCIVFALDIRAVRVKRVGELKFVEYVLAHGNVTRHRHTNTYRHNTQVNVNVHRQSSG